MSAHGSPRGQLETLLLRSRTFTDRRCFDIHVSPLPCRRTASVVSEFLPLTPFRSRSSRSGAVPPPRSAPPIIMQHQRPNHNTVSVAHFFDWSNQDKEGRLSVSKLYREIAVGVGASVPRSMSEKVRPRGAATNGAGGRTSRVSPGRMFLRDKGMLTKGEREIIEGIYRNRGDLPRKEPANILRPDFVVRSHRDAWLLGKDGDTGNKPSTELPRDPPRGALMEVMAQANHGSEYSSPRASDITRSDGQGHTTCVVCMQEQQQQQQKPHHHPPASHKAHKKSQSSALPAESVLRPMNVYDGLGHSGGVSGAGEDPPVAPPASPNLRTSPVNTERRGHNNDTVLSTSPPNATSTKLLPRRRAEATLTSRYEPEHLAQLTASRHELGYKGQSSVRYNLPGRPDAGDKGQSSARYNLPGRPDAGDKGGEPCSDGESNHESDGSRRKVQVKVYLPKVAPDPVDEDVRTCLLQGRPSLARERPLSHSDIRQEHPESGWNHRDEEQQQEGELGSHYDDTVTQGPHKEDLESEREDVVVHHNGEHDGMQQKVSDISENPTKNGPPDDKPKLTFVSKQGKENDKCVRQTVQRVSGKKSTRRKEDAAQLSSGDHDEGPGKDTPQKHALRTVTFIRADTAAGQSQDKWK